MWLWEGRLVLARGRAGGQAGCAGQGVAWLELGEEGEGGGKWGRGERASRMHRTF